MYYVPLLKIQNVCAGEQEGIVLAPHVLKDVDDDFDNDIWEDLSHSDQMLVTKILETTGGTYIVYIYIYIYTCI